MKTYRAVVKITWSNYGIDGINEEDAKKRLKELYLQEYNIDLEDNEIVSLVLDK